MSRYEKFSAAKKVNSSGEPEEKHKLIGAKNEQEMSIREGDNGAVNGLYDNS